MGLFDQMKDKASELVQGHGDKVDEAIERGGDFVDEKTGGQHADKVDLAQGKARELADGLDRSDDPSVEPGAQPT